MSVRLIVAVTDDEWLDQLRQIPNLIEVNFWSAPDMRFEVSRKIREEFENGRYYYSLHGANIQLPHEVTRHPDRSALVWHNENRFKG